MTTEERIYFYQKLEAEYLPYCLENKLRAMGFFTAPASTKYHGAYEGGLFDHSLRVCENLIDLTKKLGLKWQRPEAPFIVGMFHDLCKCDKYTKIETGYVEIGDNGVAVYRSNPAAVNVSFEYKEKTLLEGHGAKSVMILSTLLETGLTEEEMLCVRYHMGAYEKDDWNGYDLAIRKYPNVLYSHLADMIASKVDGV